MLSKRIIPCLDINNNRVVKGTQFKNHKIIEDDILSLVNRYLKEGADELIFYDITASPHGRTVDKKWITKIAEIIDIPFCVAGGIRNIQQAEEILAYGADKISINSPALENPDIISYFADRFGTQCVVVGIDTWYNSKQKCYQVNQYTGDEKYSKITIWETLHWVEKVQNLGAGEIVLNVINKDGVCNGYDIKQLKLVRNICKIPLIASGGAGNMSHFLELFQQTNVDAALAASVFHKKIININNLKQFLLKRGIIIRLC